jgi:hypothetical protein
MSGAATATAAARYQTVALEQSCEKGGGSRRGGRRRGWGGGGWRCNGRAHVVLEHVMAVHSSITGL